MQDSPSSGIDAPICRNGYGKGSKDEHSIKAAVAKRHRADVVMGDTHALGAFVPGGESKIAERVIYTSLTPCFMGAQDGLADSNNLVAWSLSVDFCHELFTAVDAGIGGVGQPEGSVHNGRTSCRNSGVDCSIQRPKLLPCPAATVNFVGNQLL